MTGRTTFASTTWVALVIMGLMGVSTVHAVDLDVCQNTCSAVPQDLWPYCCETHHTCCEKFADSCIHDCLPRISTGDVSAVEERPGMCCALYNLCCFRETPRISSIRNDVPPKPQGFPIMHRFSTLPGGPSKSSQSSVIIPQETKGVVPAPATFQDPQPSKPNRRPGSVSRPKPSRKPSNSFTDTARPSISESTRSEISNIQDSDNKRPNHRFDVRAPSPARPSPSQNSQLQEEDEVSEQLGGIRNNPRSPKLIRLNRLGSSSQPQEARKIDRAEEPAEGRTNANTPKVLDRPGPRPLIRPEQLSRTTNLRQPSNPIPKEREVTEQNADEEEKKVKLAFPNRPSQPRPLSPLKVNDQSETTETVNTKSKQDDRLNKFPRPGPQAHFGDARKDKEPVSEVTEEPEQIDTTERESRPQSLKLLQPNIKPLRIGNLKSVASIEPLQSDSSSTFTQTESNPTKLSLKEATTDAPRDVLKRPNTFLQERTLRLIPEKEEKTTDSITAQVTEDAPKINVAPIRKVKRIRTRGPGKTIVSQNTGRRTLGDSNTAESQRTFTAATTTVTATTVATPTTRSQVSRGRSRSHQTATTAQPQATRGRSRGRTQGTQDRSRSTTRVAQDTTSGSSRSRSTQGSATTRSRGSSRSRSQATDTSRQTENTQAPDRSVNNLSEQETAKNSYLPLPKVEEMLKEVPKEPSTTPLVKEDKIITVPDKAEKKATEVTLALPEKSPDAATPETPLEARELPSIQPQIKKIKLFKPQQESETSVTQQPQEVQPEQIKQVEEPSKIKEAADQVSVLLPSSKTQQSSQEATEQQPPRPAIKTPAPKLVIKTPAPRPGSKTPIPRVTSSKTPAPRGSSQPDSTRQSSAPRPQRQQSEPQETRQRSSTQSASTRRSDPAPRQSSTRSRGRLTARQQLALTGSQ